MPIKIHDHSKEKLINLLFSEARGRILALNGYHCFILGYLSDLTVKKYMNACYKYFIDLAVDNFDDLYKMLSIVSNNGFFFNGNNICSDVDNEEIMVSNVIEYRTLAEHYFDIDALSHGHAALDIAPDLLDGENIKDVLIVLNREGKIKNLFKENAKLGGNQKKQIFWITPTIIISELRRKNRKKLSDHVRNALGLVHYNKDSYLVELVFLGKKIRNISYYPTFIEGSDHRRFKAMKWCSDYSNWGRTANLDLIQITAVNIDGVPEQVVKPIKIETLEVDIKDIGFIENVSTGASDEVFLQCLLSGSGVPIDMSDVEQFYRDLLN